MTNYLKCLILLLFVGNLAIAGEKKVRCVIRGELIGMEAKEVLLVDATVDSRYHGTYVPGKRMDVLNTCWNYRTWRVTN